MRRLMMLFLVLPLMAACGQTAQEPSAATATPDDSPLETGDHEVYFAAFTTDQLSPEVARAYGITRSATRGLVNISVLRKQDDAPGKPVTARVAGSGTNLAAQLRELSWRELRDGEAIYYIAELPVTDRETVVFNIQVTPEGENRPIPLRFSQQFYTR